MAKGRRCRRGAEPTVPTGPTRELGDGVRASTHQPESCRLAAAIAPFPQPHSTFPSLLNEQTHRRMAHGGKDGVDADHADHNPQ
eukprot:scaffold106535_cov35-Tisochrysis_lutea.AAC.1